MHWHEKMENWPLFIYLFLLNFQPCFFDFRLGCNKLKEFIKQVLRGVIGFKKPSRSCGRKDNSRTGRSVGWSVCHNFQEPKIPLPCCYRSTCSELSLSVKCFRISATVKLLAFFLQSLYEWDGSSFKSICSVWVNLRCAGMHKLIQLFILFAIIQVHALREQRGDVKI